MSRGTEKNGKQLSMKKIQRNWKSTKSEISKKLTNKFKKFKKYLKKMWQKNNRQFFTEEHLNRFYTIFTLNYRIISKKKTNYSIFVINSIIWQINRQHFCEIETRSCQRPVIWCRGKKERACEWLDESAWKIVNNERTGHDIRFNSCCKRAVCAHFCVNWHLTRVQHASKSIQSHMAYRNSYWGGLHAFDKCVHLFACKSVWRCRVHS